MPTGRIAYVTLMRRTVDDLPADVRRALVERLEAAPVSIAVLFGSYARGEATSSSDVDIAVEYDQDVENYADEHLSLVADLTRILGTDDVDVVRLSVVDPRIAVEALEDGLLLVGGPDDARERREALEPERRRREDAVAARIEDAERKIRHRLGRHESG